MRGTPIGGWNEAIPLSHRSEAGTQTQEIPSVLPKHWDCFSGDCWFAHIVYTSIISVPLFGIFLATSFPRGETISSYASERLCEALEPSLLSSTSSDSSGPGRRCLWRDFHRHVTGKDGQSCIFSRKLWIYFYFYKWTCFVFTIFVPCLDVLYTDDGKSKLELLLTFWTNDQCFWFFFPEVQWRCLIFHFFRQLSFRWKIVGHLQFFT